MITVRNRSAEWWMVAYIYITWKCLKIIKVHNLELSKIYTNILCKRCTWRVESYSLVSVSEREYTN